MQTVQHGQIWKTPAGDFIAIVQHQGTDNIAYVNLSSSHGGPPAQINTIVKKIDDENDHIIPQKSLLVQTLPPNPSNFRMTGDDARMLQTALLCLAERQRDSNQSMLNRLGEISQVQPPQGG